MKSASLLLLCLAAHSVSPAATVYFASAGGAGLETALPFESTTVPNGTIVNRLNSVTVGSSNAAYNSLSSLTEGRIRIATSGHIGSTPLTSPGGEAIVASAFAVMGDTFNKTTGPIAGGLPLGMQLNLSGSWASGSLTNWSFVRLLLLRDGSFGDLDNFATPANILSEVIYLIGPGGQQPPFLNAATGSIGSIPGSVRVEFPVLASALPTRFQVAVVAQILLVGNNPANVTWNVDLGSTIDATLITPDDVTLVSDGGGFPTMTQSASSVPEPGTLGFAAVGLALLWAGRRKR